MRESRYEKPIWVGRDHPRHAESEVWFHGEQSTRLSLGQSVNLEETSMIAAGSPAMGSLFLGLAFLMTWVALNPRTREHCAWGRTSTQIPMSGVGRIVVIAVFLLISAAAFGWLPLMTIFLAVPLLACAGVYDSWKHRRQGRD